MIWPFKKLLTNRDKKVQQKSQTSFLKVIAFINTL